MDQDTMNDVQDGAGTAAAMALALYGGPLGMALGAGVMPDSMWDRGDRWLAQNKWLDAGQYIPGVNCFTEGAQWGYHGMHMYHDLFQGDFGGAADEAWQSTIHAVRGMPLIGRPGATALEKGVTWGAKGVDKLIEHWDDLPFVSPDEDACAGGTDITQQVRPTTAVEASSGRAAAAPIREAKPWAPPKARVGGERTYDAAPVEQVFANYQD